MGISVKYRFRRLHPNLQVIDILDPTFFYAVILYTHTTGLVEYWVAERQKEQWKLEGFEPENRNFFKNQ